MALVNDYRIWVRQFLRQQTSGKVNSGDIELKLVFDLERDRYLLIALGWRERRRIHNCVMDLEIIDNQVWIQRNQTDRVIAEDLVAMGVGREDIVIGWHPSAIRALVKQRES